MTMGSCGRALQLTLAIFKPAITSHPHHVHELKQLIHKNGFYFIQSQSMYLPRKRVEQFYGEHEGKFFYNRLVSYMSSGPISTHILARENAIPKWREIMGPTKVFRSLHSHPDSIRGKFGLTDTRNATHGSDSEETARKEIGFFFPDFDIDLWYRDYEQQFVKGHVEFDEEMGIHICKPTFQTIDTSTDKKIARS